MFSGAITQFESELIRERMMAGLGSARGRLGGRPPAFDEKTRALAVTIYKNSSHLVKDIWATLGISRTTLYRCVDHVSSDW